MTGSGAREEPFLHEQSHKTQHTKRNIQNATHKMQHTKCNTHNTRTHNSPKKGE